MLSTQLANTRSLDLNLQVFCLHGGVLTVYYLGYYLGFALLGTMYAGLATNSPLGTDSRSILGLPILVEAVLFKRYRGVPITAYLARHPTLGLLGAN